MPFLWIIQRTIPRVEIPVKRRTVSAGSPLKGDSWRLVGGFHDDLMTQVIWIVIYKLYIYNKYMCVYIYIYIYIYLSIYVRICVFVCIWTYNDIMKYVFNLFHVARGVQCVFFKGPFWRTQPAKLGRNRWHRLHDSTLIPGVLGLYVILI